MVAKERPSTKELLRWSGEKRRYVTCTDFLGNGPVIKVASISKKESDY
jgi:hypothetical protein